MTRRNLIIITGISGALAVGLGAFGAHGLEASLRESGRLDTFETAVQYHFYHTLLLGIIGAAWDNLKGKYRKIAAYLIVAGIIIFSGSLYILCLTGITWLGAVTPIGGISFILGWLALAGAAMSGKT